ncbi:MAG: nicotinamidase-related amidase [Shewanella psychromarinicola]|jgi:nicotinamidase-related amidase|uniref:hydrolase n=1 Tax=Shewanella psychromarinicola TaxID=2487742 RepID=UPI003EEA616D
MLTAEQSVLMIVDVQGKLAQVMQQSAPLHQKLAILIQGAQLFDIPIIWLEQLPDKLGHTSEELSQLLSQTTQPIAKKHFSGWHCEEVKQQLNSLKRHNVILAGIETHVCVYQTCQDLLANDYQVHLVADAVSSRGTDNKVLGVQMMLNDGAKLTNVESLLFELQHVAQGDHFKALLKLIK